jgi:hypothetical protein
LPGSRSCPRRPAGPLPTAQTQVKILLVWVRACGLPNFGVVVRVVCVKQRRAHKALLYGNLLMQVREQLYRLLRQGVQLDWGREL